MHKPHRQRHVWQDSITVAEAVYAATERFPDEERFGLVSQMRRCAVSIPSNIAEGAAKDSPAGYSCFLTIAIGSVAELDTQLELSNRLESLNTEDHEQLDTKPGIGSRMLIALHRSIRAKI
ncbi:four helix bundle protein [Roseimaritima ulvae]|uniref:four helix bundle protein n=1 Tax=Roseimaritima ulvae TaxID=980254 RepID=UPI000829EAF1|nr:four helix bundle protein [Roseimaritima ulvae]